MHEPIAIDQPNHRIRPAKDRDRLSRTLQDRWLHIPVEIRLRELDSKLLLACCAAERGARALIGEFGLFSKFSDI